MLWIDDQITAFGSHIDELEETGYSITEAATAEEALSTIAAGSTFDVILVDLKMPDADGIELLARVCGEVEDLKQTKIIVLSSFLYEPRIRRRLVDLDMNVALLEKTGGTREGGSTSLAERIGDVLSRGHVASPVDQFTRWDEQASASDPFEISLRAYLDSPLVVRYQLDEKAEKATRMARRQLNQQGVIWSLFCGSSNEPLSSATDAGEIPSDDQVFALASGLDHPPYEFFEDGQFEEHTAEGRSDSRATGSGGCPGSPDYPFFRIGIVHHHDRGVSVNLSRDFHFDSGLDMTAFALETALEIGLEVDKARPAKFVRYSGVHHAFYPASGDGYVVRGSRGTLSVSVAGRAYVNWDDTPFSRRCRDFKCAVGSLCFRRHALLGRDLLVDNQLELDLKPIGF